MAGRLVLAPADHLLNLLAHGFQADVQGFQRPDRHAPTHTPQPDDRIFIDLTLERARALRREYVARYWDEPEHGLAVNHDTPDEAIEALAQSDVRPRLPWLITVNGPG